MNEFLQACLTLEEQSCDAGTLLIREGVANNWLFVLREGEVEISRKNVRIASVTKKGAVLGELSVLLGCVPVATAKALTPCKYHVIEDVARFIEGNPRLGYQLARLLARRLQGITETLVEVRQTFPSDAGCPSRADQFLDTLEALERSLVDDWDM